MSEVVIKIDVPKALEPEFSSAIGRVTEEFIGKLRESVAKEILSESKLTEKQALELAKELRLRIAKRHGLL